LDRARDPRALADLAGLLPLVLDLAECAFVDSVVLGAFVGDGKILASVVGRLLTVNARGAVPRAAPAARAAVRWWVEQVTGALDRHGELVA